MINRIVLLLFAGLMVSCIDNNKRTIEDWQVGLKSEHPKINNILLQADKGFFLSFNRVDNHNYSFFFQNVNEYKIQKSIETWLETYINERKVILDAGYTIKSGITFKQTENFNRLHFIYRVGGNESLIFLFILVDGKWQYIGANDELGTN